MPAFEVARVNNVEEANLGAVCDYSNDFRDADDKTVITVNSYYMIPIEIVEQYLYGYDVEILK